MVPSIYLVGFMGSGKSTVGRRLAEILGRDFLDLDTLIEQREGRAVREIFEQSGEAGFREIEASVLGEVVQRRPAVVALGGGAWLSARNRDLIGENGVSVHLDTSLEAIRQRVVSDGTRPLFSDPERVAALYTERLPFYQMASVTVRTGDSTADDIAKQILDELGST
jgi:shikimate kinase